MTLKVLKIQFLLHFRFSNHLHKILLIVGFPTILRACPNSPIILMFDSNEFGVKKLFNVQ